MMYDFDQPKPRATTGLFCHWGRVAGQQLYGNQAISCCASDLKTSEMSLIYINTHTQ